MLRSQT